MEVTIEYSFQYLYIVVHNVHIIFQFVFAQLYDSDVDAVGICVSFRFTLIANSFIYTFVCCPFYIAHVVNIDLWGAILAPFVIQYCYYYWKKNFLFFWYFVLLADFIRGNSSAHILLLFFLWVRTHAFIAAALKGK